MVSSTLVTVSMRAALSVAYIDDRRLGDKLASRPYPDWLFCYVSESAGELFMKWASASSST